MKGPTPSLDWHGRGSLLVFLAMRLLLLTAASVVLLTRPAAAEPDKSEATKALEAAIRKALNGAGPAVDACVERYLVERPTTDAKATLDLSVVKTGMVDKCTVEAPVENARSLKECLERAAKGIKFPSPGDGGATLKLEVPVKKGAKFRVPEPGEKPPAAEGQGDDGFVQFFPTGWVPQQ